MFIRKANSTTLFQFIIKQIEFRKDDVLYNRKGDWKIYSYYCASTEKSANSNGFLSISCNNPGVFKVLYKLNVICASDIWKDITVKMKGIRNIPIICFKAVL